MACILSKQVEEVRAREEPHLDVSDRHFTELAGYARVIAQTICCRAAQLRCQLLLCACRSSQHCFSSHQQGADNIGTRSLPAFAKCQSNVTAALENTAGAESSER